MESGKLITAKLDNQRCEAALVPLTWPGWQRLRVMLQRLIGGEEVLEVARSSAAVVGLGLED
jgi:hypothetical protein